MEDFEIYASPLDVEADAAGECPDWGNSEELARYVFRRLDGLSKCELLLVHDLEEYLDANFDFPERRDMSRYPVD
ncbi:hypothetical protein StrepF001_27000 [Streptomyces sp. F001]|uniref:hypothetical protein n=1 Tax=Streptomyces sp. F001 TaxID=1510026 RepID=UPI00101E7258|nr:hypothetical protein [Streptomyces sp. F001]RZB16342.1 hypothetical protein StrepF001_27000 [Streptomyces sp. F001]